MGSNAGRDISINIEIPCDTGGTRSCVDPFSPESLPKEAQERRAASVGAGAARLEEALKALRPMREGGLLGPSEVDLVERLECWHTGLKAEIDRQNRRSGPSLIPATSTRDRCSRPWLAAARRRWCSTWRTCPAAAGWRSSTA